MKMINRMAVVLHPKQPFLQWVQSVDPDPVSAEEIGLEPTVYLIPDFEDVEDGETYLQLHYDILFEEELGGWYTDEDAWPGDRSYAMFREWFEVELHSMILDLAPGRIIQEEY